MKLTPQAVTLSSGHRYPEAQLLHNGQQGIIYLSTSQLRAAWRDHRVGSLRYEVAGGEGFNSAAE